MASISLVNVSVLDIILPKELISTFIRATLFDVATLLIRNSFISTKYLDNLHPNFGSQIRIQINRKVHTLKGEEDYGDMNEMECVSEKD